MNVHININICSQAWETGWCYGDADAILIIGRVSTVSSFADEQYAVFNSMRMPRTTYHRVQQFCLVSEQDVWSSGLRSQSGELAYMWTCLKPPHVFRGRFRNVSTTCSPSRPVAVTTGVLSGSSDIEGTVRQELRMPTARLRARKEDDEFDSTAWLRRNGLRTGQTALC